MHLSCRKCLTNICSNCQRARVLSSLHVKAVGYCYLECPTVVCLVLPGDLVDSVGNDVPEVGWQEPSPSCESAWASARAFCAANGGLYTIQVQLAEVFITCSSFMRVLGRCSSWLATGKLPRL
jgi:hypothetical protein